VSPKEKIKSLTQAQQLVVGMCYERMTKKNMTVLEKCYVTSQTNFSLCFQCTGSWSHFQFVWCSEHLTTSHCIRHGIRLKTNHFVPFFPYVGINYCICIRACSTSLAWCYKRSMKCTYILINSHITATLDTIYIVVRLTTFQEPDFLCAGSHSVSAYPIGNEDFCVNIVDDTP
jgi:hypothetical protein